MYYLFEQTYILWIFKHFLLLKKFTLTKVQIKYFKRYPANLKDISPNSTELMDRVIIIQDFKNCDEYLTQNLKFEHKHRLLQRRGSFLRSSQHLFLGKVTYALPAARFEPWPPFDRHLRKWFLDEAAHNRRVWRGQGKTRPHTVNGKPSPSFFWLTGTDTWIGTWNVKVNLISKLNSLTPPTFFRLLIMLGIMFMPGLKISTKQSRKQLSINLLLHDQIKWGHDLLVCQITATAQSSWQAHDHDLIVDRLLKENQMWFQYDQLTRSPFCYIP